MKQGHLDLIFFIVAGFEIRLEKITSVARQSEVLEIIGTAACLWVNMLHFEGKVEDTLRCVTVFAPVRCPFSNGGIPCVHGWVGRT